MLLLTALAGIFVSLAAAQPGLNVGRGIADMTGLAAEGALYGYANPNQDARGLHLRQYSRAFVFESQGNRAAFVVTETTMISQALKLAVVERLESIYGNLYSQENVMLVPTHSHSAPGGYHTYWMYMIACSGFVNETFDAYVNGIVTSIQRATDDVKSATVYVNEWQSLDASVSRSPYSYDQNPAAEKAMYQYNVDRDMLVMKIVSHDESEEMGIISMFPTHTTSMKNYNHLVSSDNKGYSSILFEAEKNSGAFPGQGSFLAAFAQTNQGDASPNTDGERCAGTDSYCSYNTSICPEDPEDPSLCTGRGPAGEQFEDTRIIGERQYQAAKAAYESATRLVDSPVDFRFTWVNMSEVVVNVTGTPTQLCRASMGYSFAAGATDGPGIPPFTQGMLKGIPRINFLVRLLFGLPDDLVECQKPKPVLLPTGVQTEPFLWQPEIVPLQLLRVGDVVFIGVPSEFTTMAGRRLRKAVKQALVDNGFPESTITVIAGMTNSYTSYTVTREEYSVQRYEGASTIYGQYTLDGYIKVFSEMAVAMATDSPYPYGQDPPDLRGLQQAALGPVLTDGLDEGSNYGDVITDVDTQYLQGEVASATFTSGNPRNDLKTDSTFLEVQQYAAAGDTWNVVYGDAHWETKFIWLSDCQTDHGICVFPNITGCEPLNYTVCDSVQTSNATIEWDIPTDQAPGTYRLVHYGNALTEAGDVVPYTGTSSSFEVLSTKSPVKRVHSLAYYNGVGMDDLDRRGPLDGLQQAMANPLIYLQFHLMGPRALVDYWANADWQ